ncbi:sphingosine 1-phosphate receptor 3-like [Asterias rubens]|uniref:sphingosine 1-phosphate receptor 3-like n=1 Tax=Asterias rubens TaxID=7604 RepID=UPI0014550CED|nr:sphingosine 1-phosphate receptor 3-like [Asterias rubens]
MSDGTSRGISREELVHRIGMAQGIIGMILNTLAWLVILRTKNLHNMTNYLLAYLAVSDCVFCFSVVLYHSTVLYSTATWWDTYYQATLKRSAQQLQQQNAQAAALELLQARQNVMNTLRIVMGALVVLWTPLAIRIMLCSLSKDENLCGSKTSQVIGILLVAMYNMNSVINPIIYVFKYKKFRRGLQDMLCCCVGRPLRRNRIEVQIAMNEHTA